MYILVHLLLCIDCYLLILSISYYSGEIPPELYKKLDYLADTFGQGDLRATTRQGNTFIS